MQYTENFKKLLNGDKVDDAGDIEIVGGARINYVLHDVFQKTIANVDPNAGIVRPREPQSKYQPGCFI